MDIFLIWFLNGYHSHLCLNEHHSHLGSEWISFLLWFWMEVILFWVLNGHHSQLGFEWTSFSFGFWVYLIIIWALQCVAESSNEPCWISPFHGKENWIKWYGVVKCLKPGARCVPIRIPWTCLAVSFTCGATCLYEVHYISATLARFLWSVGATAVIGFKERE